MQFVIHVPTFGEGLATVDREIFMLKIIRVKNFRVDKFLRFRSILEIVLCKMFYS